MRPLKLLSNRLVARVPPGEAELGIQLAPRPLRLAESAWVAEQVNKLDDAVRVQWRP